MLQALLLTGCSSAIAVQAVGAALNAALEATDLKKREPRETPEKPEKPPELALRLDAGTEINSTKQRVPLSLVVRIYSLKSGQTFNTLTYEEAADPASALKVLGSEVIAEREMILLPGKTYDLKQQLTPDANVIGVVALFRSPFQNRWKLAFDGKASRESGITVGVHSCALTAGHGAILYPNQPDRARSLLGVRCKG